MKLIEGLISSYRWLTLESSALEYALLSRPILGQLTSEHG